jgi:hypothetical protein
MQFSAYFCQNQPIMLIFAIFTKCMHLQQKTQNVNPSTGAAAFDH